MTDLRAAAELALGALEYHQEQTRPIWRTNKAIEALEAALAEPVQDHFPDATKMVQEPVAWYFEARHIDSAWGPAVSLKHPGAEGVYLRKVTPLYAAPPQRKPLTEEEIENLNVHYLMTHAAKATITRAVEQAHQIGVKT